MLFKISRNYLPIFFVIILALVLRFWQLGNVPISMSDDEIRETYVSYSIAHTAKDYYGNFLPIVFKMDGFNTYGVVPIYIRSLFFLFLDLNPFSARFPYALASVGSVILLFLLIKKLFNSKIIALTSSVLIAISVWQIQLSRIAIETNITIFLYLLGITIYLYARERTKWIFVSMLVLFSAFYGYSAFKTFFLPLVLILLWYNFKKLGKKNIFIIIITIIICFLSFGWLNLTKNAGSYAGVNGNQFFFQDKEKTALNVELERRASNEPEIIKNFYHNKFTYWFRQASSNYLYAFSPQYLFLNQEASGIYSIWGRGMMYFFEMPLIIFGLIYLFKKKKRESLFILFLLLISPLASTFGIGTPTWTSRSALMPFWLYVFIGAGAYCLITFPKKKVLRIIILFFFVLLYIYGLTGYLYQYYYDWARTNAKYFSKSTKDLVDKIDLYNEKGKEVIVAGAAENTFLHYAFYNKIEPKIVQNKINKFPIQLNNFTLQKTCLIDIPLNSVYITAVNCRYEATPSGKIKTYDNTEVIWNIYER